MPMESNDLWMTMQSEFFGNDDVNPAETVQTTDLQSSVADHRQILNILFLIDVSGSMRGKRIAQVNYALENIFKELKKRDEVDSAIKVGIMEFSDQAKWITPQPVPLEDFPFTQIEAQPWITCYAKAFDLLNQKLSRSEFLNPSLGEYFAPLILFITDGEPVDGGRYPEALARLKQNGWFRKSAKYAVAVGEEARNESIGSVLAEFTGVRENVRYADEGDALCNLIEFIAVRGSEVQTAMISSGGVNGKAVDDRLFDTLDGALFTGGYRR